MSLWTLLFTFMKIGVLCFGGAYAAIPVVEREVVDVCHWMTYTEFADLLVIDEMTPGPILINSASYVGMRMAGVPGAIVASIGCCIPPIIITTILIFIYRKYRDISFIGGILYALKCMALAMMMSTCLSIILNAVFPGRIIALNNVDYLLLTMSIASFLIIRKFQPNPLYVMLACGALNLIVRGFLHL
ncbi:MAG: chromate transporter [Erysipelotrichaceae bacterium]|nr:chromate transporter [Erysipelotrichaceae bacterium]